jgi:tRNA1(Val) A37 N6-methylase TrmN6
MIRHDTPSEIASALTKHIPSRISSLLEPAVGTGQLLESLHIERHQSLQRIVCLDTDPTAISEVQNRFCEARDRLKVIRADFLEWSAPKHRYRSSSLFDCILMNPPFAGRRFVDLSQDIDMPAYAPRNSKVPIEVAFVFRAIKLLNRGGRMLAVIPSNIVSALSAKWIRDFMMNCGSVRYVHELPPYTFHRVEARVYLFVFEKAVDGKNTVLSNHDLVQPLVLKVSRSELSAVSRFDYRFHEAAAKYRGILETQKRFEWKPLSQYATIYRGPTPSPKGKRHALHTSDYRDGFWQANKDKKIRTDSSERGIKRGDLLVKRVGRACSASVGKVIGSVGKASSDCILILRPRSAFIETSLLLFAIRVIATSAVGPALFESGTGASYLTERTLSSILIPRNLEKFYPSYFSKYKRAIRRKDFSAMLAIEREVQKRLQLD